MRAKPCQLTRLPRTPTSTVSQVTMIATPASSHVLPAPWFSAGGSSGRRKMLCRVPANTMYTDGIQ